MIYYIYIYIYIHMVYFGQSICEWTKIGGIPIRKSHNRCPQDSPELQQLVQQLLKLPQPLPLAQRAQLCWACAELGALVVLLGWPPGATCGGFPWHLWMGNSMGIPWDLPNEWWEIRRGKIGGQKSEMCPGFAE